jgi:hypothetical protein
MRRPDSYASLQPTHSTIVSIINPSYRSLPVTSKHTALPRSHLPHQPNPHSGVRGILRAPSPAGSFLGGFRTPATGVCRAAVAGRHPKPSTNPDQAVAADREAYLITSPLRAGKCPWCHRHRGGKSQAGGKRCRVGRSPQDADGLQRPIHNRGRQVHDQGRYILE